MAKRSIEETFKAVKPKGRKGIPNPPTIAVGAASNNSDLSTSLSQAGQQIAQLQSLAETPIGPQERFGVIPDS